MTIRERATACLKSLYGPDAAFHEGQFESIEATLTNHRTLVVQKTGWGKSLVYFICTKLQREDGKGATLVVSPLLALMDNQLEAAKTMGLTCDVLNSTTSDRREEILSALKNNELDLVLVTPETLFREDIQQILPEINFGLFVIDEAHCISDWGHDFRLEYSRLSKVIEMLPLSVPVLGTTATANDRVIEDLRHQLGDDVFVCRGSLLRDNLYIQVLNMPNQAARYAWILQHMPELSGSGIIYCLTQRDCDYLADFLSQNGISARSYYSRNKADEYLNEEALDAFIHNEIKALVATIKLGMGFDKGDVAFIIHFQSPQNIVSYYQQIGRAGRNIPQAYTFLMMGQEDRDIAEYFIRTAFPSENELIKIRTALIENEGLGKMKLAQYVNMPSGRREKALSFLEHDGLVYYDREDRVFRSTPKPFVYNAEYYDAIKATRYAELSQMEQLTTTHTCYNRFIIDALNDTGEENCGFCANCCGEKFSAEVDPQLLERALQYLNTIELTIEPRKRWAGMADHPLSNKVIKNKMERGISLARLGDPGYGAQVRLGLREGAFSRELVGRSAKALRPLAMDKGITAVVPVPSSSSSALAVFAEDLASSLGLDFYNVLSRDPYAPGQSEMENSSFQCANALAAYSLDANQPLPQRVLLVDDLVDSRWTLTVCADLLMNAGVEMVVPFALADKSRETE